MHSKRLLMKKMNKEVNKWMFMKHNIILDLKSQEVHQSLNTHVKFETPSDKSHKLEKKKEKRQLKEKNKNSLNLENKQN